MMKPCPKPKCKTQGEHGHCVDCGCAIEGAYGSKGLCGECSCEEDGE